MNKKNFQIIKYCIFLKFSPKSQPNHFITSFITIISPVKPHCRSNNMERVIFVDWDFPTSICWYILLIINTHNLLIKCNILTFVIYIYLIFVYTSPKDESASRRCNRYTFHQYINNLIDIMLIWRAVDVSVYFYPFI